MAQACKLNTLLHTHIAQSMDQRQLEVLSALQTYLSQNTITDFETYTLDKKIKQGS